ncbi:hypothetical protein KAI68_00885 [bacterium]|nr:hypothetical protein [bacterium]
MKERKGILYFILVLTLSVMMMSCWFIGKSIFNFNFKDAFFGEKTILPEEEKISRPFVNWESEKAKEMVDRRQGRIDFNDFLGEKKDLPKKKEISVSDDKKDRKITKKTMIKKEKIPVIFKELILDDFDQRSFLNSLGENSGIFSGGGGACDRFFSSDDFFPQGYSLKLDYDVSIEKSYSGFWSGLGGIDLKSYEYLSFWVKGLKGKESFKIELSDGINNYRLSIRKFLSGNDQSSWQRVFIPLSRYFKGINWRKMKGNLTITFEYSEGLPYKNTVFIERISFVSEKKKGSKKKDG